MKVKNIIYKKGGYDASKPNNNILKEEEVDIRVDPVTRMQLFLELSERGLYKVLINNKNKLSERALILLEESPRFDIDSIIVEDITKLLGLTYTEMEIIFNIAKRHRNA